MPGHLLRGHDQGRGKIYQQTVIDAHNSLVFAKLHLSKVPMTAVDVLDDRVLPFYEEHGVEIERVLTDNGREYCGRPLQHAYELYLAIQQIEHRRTDIGSSESNSFCERFHRTVKEEFYSVAFRKTFYESLDQLRRDRERAHQGYRTQGRTPYQAFVDGIEAMQAQEAALAGTESGSATSPDGFDSSQKEVRPRPPRLRSAATGAHWSPPISS